MAIASGAFIQDRGAVMMQVGSSFPAGYTNDSIFGYDDGVNKWINPELNSIVPCRKAGIYSNGVDMTTKINTALANSGITGIKFEVKGGGAITVNGTVTVPTGKYLIFSPGTYLTGSGTINGGIIDAPFRSKIFDITLTVSPATLSMGKWSVMWFGAVGNGVTDDQPAIQKTVDCALASNIQYVYLPGNTYKIGKGILVKKGLNQFVTGFRMEGDVTAYAATSQISQTILTTSNNQTFILGVHKGKGVRISNILLRGANTAISLLSLYDVWENPSTDFTGGCRNNVTSPHAGIIIDPFVSNSSYPDAERYPDFTAYYLSGDGGGGSTDIVIDNCRVTNCVVGYCYTPHTIPQNGDAMALNNSWGDNCKAAISIGQSQNRTIQINNFKCWGQTETVFDCTSYADGAADNPEVDGLNIAGSVRYLCRLSGYANKGLQIRRAHMESIYSLGGKFDLAQAGDLIIEDTWINFVDSATYGSLGPFTIHDPYTIFCGGNLIFKNSKIGKYTSYSKPLAFMAANVSFESCILDSLAVNRWAGGGYGQITYRNCNGLVGTFGTEDKITLQNPNNFGATNLVILLSNSEISYQQVRNPALPVGCNFSYVRKRRQNTNTNNLYLSREWQYFTLSSGSLQFTNIDSNALTANIVVGAGADYNKVQIGDQIYLNGGTLIPDEYGATNKMLNVGIVTAKNGTDTITLSYTGRGIAAATNYSFYIARAPFMLCWLVIGDCTSGSPIVSNCIVEVGGTMNPVPGLTINSPYFPEGTWIVSVSGTNITLSNNANRTVSNVDLVGADWQGIEYGAVNTSNANHRGYKIGDIIYNTDFVNFPSIYKWRCIQSGVTSTSRLPVFSSEAL